jgi:hypothetical protein
MLLDERHCTDSHAETPNFMREVASDNPMLRTRTATISLPLLGPLPPLIKLTVALL